MAQNPWAVDSIKAFYFLKCPECDFDTKEENSFENHATKHHPQSFVLFDKKRVVKDFETIDIKEEPLFNFDNQNSYEGQKPSTLNPFSQLSPITEDNSTFVVPEVKREPTDKSYTENTELRDHYTKRKQSLHLDSLKKDFPQTTPKKRDRRAQLTTSSFSKSAKQIYEASLGISKNLLSNAVVINCYEEMENCSNDGAIIGNNPGEDPLKMSVYEEKKPHKCLICNKSFRSKFDMKKHIKCVQEGKNKHEGKKENKCFICHEIFGTNKTLKGHMSYVHKEKMPVHEKKKQYVCITCNKSFGKQIEMKKHIESIHTIPISVNNISRKESLKFDSTIETNSMNIAGTPEKNEKSAKIEVDTSDDKIENNDETRDLFDQENLHKEVRFQNQIEQSSINEDKQCAVHERKKQSYCTNLSPSKKNENIETPTTSSNTVHDLGNNPSSKHNCGRCGKSFKCGRNLRDHIKNVHEGIKSFSCKNCKKCFSQEGALKRHIESVHENKRNFQCPHCKINLSAKDSLAKHISVVHEKKKPFYCDTCNKNFGTKLQLERHKINKHHP